MKNLEGMHYDAFISYRHCDPDSFVAQTLHRRLEAFRLPRPARGKVGSEKTKIERIFRDEEELPLSEDLSEPISNALANSEFLICICTPRYLESRWCMMEIEVFLRTHKRDHILVVLADGEPADAFPEILTYDEIEKKEIEPLAADTRGDSKKEVLKKMETAVLKLSAAIFGLNYDDLRQRHREAKLKRMMAFGGCIGAAVLAFAVFATVTMIKISNQNAEISEQNREITKQKDTISSQYDELQDKYADQIAESAKQTLSLGRREDAIRDLQSVLPASKDKSYNVNAMRTLYSALNIYGIDNVHVPSRIYENDSDIVTFDVSSDEKYILIVGYSGIRVYDRESGETIYEKNKESNGEGGEGFDAAFCGSKGIIVIDGQSREYYPISDDKGENIKPVLLPEEIYEYTTFYHDNKNELTVVSGEDELLAIGESGKVKYRVDIAKEFGETGLEITGISFGKDHSVASFKNGESVYMLVFDSKSGDPIYHCKKNMNYSAVATVNGNTLCYAASDEKGGKMKTEAAAIDIKSGKQKWKTEISDQTVVDICREKDRIFVRGGSFVSILSTSGELLSTYDTETAIVSSWVSDGDYYYLCSSGDLFSCDEGSKFNISESFFQYAPANEVSLAKCVNDVLYYDPNYSGYIIRYAPEVSDIAEKIGEEYSEKNYYSDPELKEKTDEVLKSVKDIDEEMVAEAFFSNDKKYLCVYCIHSLYIVDVENKCLVQTVEAARDEYEGMRFSDVTGGYIIDTYRESFILDDDFNIVCTMDRIVDEEKDGFVLKNYKDVFFRVPYISYDELAEIAKKK